MEKLQKDLGKTPRLSLKTALEGVGCLSAGVALKSALCHPAPMKSRFHRFAILLAGGICGVFAPARGDGGNTGGAPDDGAIPKGYPMARYAPLWEHSPFVLASVAEAPAPGFAQNLAVVAIARVDDEDLVTVVNKQSQERITLDGQPNAQGMKVVSVEADTDPLKTKVTLQKGGETATLGFDRALMTAPQAPAREIITTSNNRLSPATPPAAAAEQPPNAARRVVRMPPIPGAKPVAAEAPANPATAPANNNVNAPAANGVATFGVRMPPIPGAQPATAGAPANPAPAPANNGAATF